MRWRRLVDRPDRGAGGESLELIVVAAALLLLVTFGIAAARYSTGSNRVEQAAAVAARAASLQRDANSADQAANDEAAATLEEAGVSCRSMTLTVDTADFARPPGQPGMVRATVTCTVEWSDLSVPGLPGSVTLTGTATSMLDTGQERS
jgi:Flp pilus assembly protein TadG